MSHRGLAITLLTAWALAQLTHCAAQGNEMPAGMPTSGGYKPPALSLESLLESDKLLSDALMNYARTGDSASFRHTVQSSAASGHIGAELLLAEQYIPEQCTFEPDRDVPNCGPDGKQPPHVVFRNNPLNITASYEDAARWLERASAQGSGEASEVLAQLITRMLANEHPTAYTAADSTRLHALARSQGFDIEAVQAHCYRHMHGEGPLRVTGLPDQHELSNAGRRDPIVAVTAAQLQALANFGLTGTLALQGGSGFGENVLLSRPEGPMVHVSVILDHDPGHEVHLAIPAHHDAIYVQRGDTFLLIPNDTPTLPRYISLMPERSDMQQVSISLEHIDGSYGGGFCDRF